MDLPVLPAAGQHFLHVTGAQNRQTLRSFARVSLRQGQLSPGSTINSNPGKREIVVVVVDDPTHAGKGTLTEKIFAYFVKLLVDDSNE